MIVMFLLCTFLNLFSFLKTCREKNKKDKLGISASCQLNSNHVGFIYGLPNIFRDRLIEGLAGPNGLWDLS